MLEIHHVPLFNITDAIIRLISEISEQVGVFAGKNENSMNMRMRKNNQIKAIHSSLAMEHNSLSLEEVTDIIDGKQIVGDPDEILAVKNAYEAYNLIPSFDPFGIDDLLKAHKILMRDLTNEAGRFRAGRNVRVASAKSAHMYPSAGVVRELTDGLLNWLKTVDVHPLVTSCVFHYEFESIRPFADGSGRLGRMWQKLLLSRWRLLFAWLPVESKLHEREYEYHKLLTTADSTVFVEFMLKMILDALCELVKSGQVRDQISEQVEHLMLALGEDTLSAQELLDRLGIKHRSTFSHSYLRPALELGLIKMTVPDKPNSSRQKYRATGRNDQ